MYLVVVCILASVVYLEGAAYQNNQAFGIPHHLIINHENPGVRVAPKGKLNGNPVRDEPARDVSYSISYGDYLYLKRHKIEGQDSPFNPEQPQHRPSISNHNGR